MAYTILNEPFLAQNIEKLKIIDIVVMLLAEYTIDNHYNWNGV
jgi:hypothetical protein